MPDEHAPPPSLDDVLQECLERFESEGPAAVDDVCRRHPALADTLRRRMERLEAMGLLGDAPERLLVVPAAMPERLGEFRLKRLLGGGGMGVVYLAEQIGLGREVALKIVRPEQLYFPGTRERFRREVETIARLRHPGIVPVHTVGEDGEIPYFAMEWVRGATLADVLEDVAGRDPAALTGHDFGEAVRRLAKDGDEADTGSWVGHVFTGTWEEACLRVVRQVADALEHAHRQGILHRDVKPSNVMITPAGRAMLLDFGLASAEGTSRLTRTGSQLGSAPYMAPEQCRGAAEDIDARTDVYALGVTLYELLTLRLPYSAPTRDELTAEILGGRPIEPSSLHRGLSWEAETVCLSAMDVDRPRRYACAADLARDLGNVLDRRPIEARRAGVVRRLRRWVERHPTLAVAVLLGALVVVGGPLGYAWLERSARERVEEKRALAETNFEDAVAAVDSLLAKVADTRLRHVPQVEEVRRALLEDALRFFERFAERKGDDPDVRFGKARMQMKAADIHRELGDPARAEEMFAGALSDLEALIAEYPARAEYRRAAGYALRNIGVQQFTTGRADEALATTARAVAMQRALVEDDGAVPDDRYELAASLQNLAIGERRRDPEEAERACREAVDLLRELVGARDEVKDRVGLARTFAILGVLYGDRGATEEALDAYGRGLATLEALAAADPDNSDHRQALAQMLNNLSSALRGVDTEQAIETVRRAIDVDRRLVEDFPGKPQHRLDLARTLNTLHVQLGDVGRHDEAAPVAAEAAGILRALTAEAPQVSEYRHELAVLLLNLSRASSSSGRHDEAEVYGLEAVEVAKTLSDGLSPARVDHLQGSAWQNVGLARKRSGRLEEAAVAFDMAHGHQARALDAHPDDPANRTSMRNHLWMIAETRLELGEPDACAEAARALAEAFPDDGKEQHRAATYLARAAAAEGREPDAAAADAEDALRLRDRAIELGFEVDLSAPEWKL